jgi:hypothetical protein
MRFQALLFALLLTLSVMAARADTRTASEAPTVVRVGLGGVTAAARADCGSVTGTDVSHTFLLRNADASPLTISRFHPSCHCTSAALVPDGGLPVVLAPGAEATVRVSVAVEPYLIGPLEKSVQVYADGRDTPIATLTLDADVRPLVSLEPTQLDFGMAPAGHVRTRTLRATLDARLAPAEGTPQLLATDPDLKVTPLAASADVTSGMRTYMYRVTLAPDAALGPVRDVLEFAHSAGQSATLGATLSDSSGVPVTGTVVGSATASPSLVAFGTVSVGHAAGLRVTLTAPHQGILAAARAVVADRDLHCRWEHGAPGTRSLVVTLFAPTPGSVQSAVIVLLANGQRLRIPITAYVTAP